MVTLGADSKEKLDLMNISERKTYILLYHVSFERVMGISILMFRPA